MMRHGLNAKRPIQGLDLAPNIIQSYIKGERQPDLNEIRALCTALDINMVRLISSGYCRSNLMFRQAKPKQRRFARLVEEAFLAIREYLPPVTTPPGLPVWNPGPTRDFFELIIAVGNYLEGFPYKKLEDFLKAANISLIGITPPNDVDFDAFLISADTHCAICLNATKPSVRLHFSILHELAHFLFDRKTGVEIDQFPTNLYDDEIDFKTQPEFIANKFAQFYLICPYTWAMEKARHWPRFDFDEAQNILNIARTSPAVMVNAIVDFLRNERYDEDRNPSFALYKEVQDKLKTLSSGDAQFIDDILHNHRIVLKDALERNKKTFTVNMFCHIREILQMDAHNDTCHS
jgi:hypothetical protein